MSSSFSMTDEAVARRDGLRRLLEDRHNPRSVHSQILGVEPPDPKLWQQLAEDMGVCAVHVPVDLGGLGLGYGEFASICGELGAVLYEGPYWGTVVEGVTALASIAHESTEGSELLARAVAGDLTLALAYRGAPHTNALPVGASVANPADNSSYTLNGVARMVVDAGSAEVLLVVAEIEGERVLMCVNSNDAALAARESVDPTRRLFDVTFDDCPSTRLAQGTAVAAMLNEVERVTSLAIAAESVRVAEVALDLGVQFAKVRVQFGKPIGAFQAVKHKCANGLIALQSAKSALAYAGAALDRSTSREAELTLLAAKVLSTDACIEVTTDALQIHGTFGYTQAALTQSYFRRARWLSLYGETSERSLIQLGTLLFSVDSALSGAATPELFTLCSPREDDPRRQKVRAWFATHPEPNGKQLLAAGYMVPQWPNPYGTDADGDLIVIIDEEMRRAGVERPKFPLGRDFIAPLMASYGTKKQQDRYIGPMLSGEEIWCELFSEPEAGSDLASLATTAVKTNDGYLINGVKTWTSQAHLANYGLLLARTDPEAPKHRGISCFIVPMDAPGVSLQAIESMEGERKWSLSFLDDVLLDSAALIGEENQGWQIALSVLANERLSMSATPGLLWGEGPSFADLLDLARRHQENSALSDRLVIRLAHGYAESLALYVMRIGSLYRSDHSNDELVPEVRRALADMHGQSMIELWRDLHGADGVQLSPAPDTEQVWADHYFAARSLTLGGGTSEIQRNVLAERVLGLPRG